MTIVFSVVTVVKNDLVGLKKTRESLEKQTYKYWIHIIIDGTPGQATQKYLNSLTYKNTKYILEPDSGIYNAMNKAWKIADPESFVHFLNARDEFADSNSLHEAANALQGRTRVKWGCTTHEEIQQNGEGWVCKLVSPPSIANQLYAFGYRSHQSVVMKAKFISQLGGFNENFEVAADWDLIIRAMQINYPVVWKYPLGRFELGGYSKDRIVKAHNELKIIRRKVLVKNFKLWVVDQIWCAYYLKHLGYFNLFSPLVNLANKQIKNFRIGPLKFYADELSPKFIIKFLKLTVAIGFAKQNKPKWSIFSLVNRIDLNYFLIKYIHKTLQIQPYSAQKSRKNRNNKI
jgi:glycosyltransferase involved in cell wall biosynthesis